jgi:hypothetical protein
LSIPDQKAILSSLLQHAAQHGVQDSAVAVVIHLDHGVEADDGIKGDYFTIGLLSPDDYLLGRLDLVV